MGIRKTVLVCMVASLLGVGIIQTALAGPGEKRFSTPDRLREFSGKKEIIALRTENSRTFEEKDGRKTVFITAEPLNYLGSDGKYYPIEMNLTSAPQSKGGKNTKKSNLDKYRHQALKNPLRTRFSDDSSDGILLERGKERIEFAIKHKNNRKAKVNKNKIRYEKVFENADLEYTVLPGCLKDELIFHSVPKTPIISYKVNFGGLKHKMAPDGTIQLINAEGNPVFDLLPSFMFEKGNPKSLKQVDTKFHWEKDGLYCDLILDMTWLKDKRRKYPIIIDPSLVSSGTDWKRFLLHSPVDGLNITCEINVNGPEWKGEFCTSYDWLYNRFRDLQGPTYIYFNGTSGHYYDKKTISSIAGHDYEVIVHGGKSNQTILFWSSDSYGSASATITYDNLFSDQKKAGKAPFHTTVESNTILKEIVINNPQTIRFNEVPGFEIYQGDNKLSLSGGAKFLPGGIYTLKLSPTDNGGVVRHQKVQIDFPYLTGDYESRIAMGTSPGYIDSTFKVPADSQLLLEYHVPENELARDGIKSYPKIKVYSDTGTTLYEKSLNSNYYNFGIHGGDILELDKEVSYHLLVSRGQSSLGAAGWGHINLGVHHQQNDIAGTVSELTLTDEAGRIVTGGYARKDYGLRFKYGDREGNTLKEYILQVTKTGENGASVTREYPFTRLSYQNGMITVPLKTGGFGFDAGDRVNCRIINAWDGFNFSTTAEQGRSFTIDDAPPVISDFSESIHETNVIDLNCIAMDNPGGCGLKSRVLTWRIDGGPVNTVNLEAGATSHTLANLPPNAKVDATLTVTDELNNTTIQHKTIYTYPERTKLIAPAQIAGTNATRYQTNLKVEKVPAAFYRVERYRDRISPETRDYDTGYLDVNALTSLKAGPPSVSITSPYPGSVFARPANITITANGFDVDGTIAKVDFYSGTTCLGTATGQPYTITWNNAPLGDYDITAKATDNDGLTTESNPVRVSVINSLPVVSITNGVSGYNTTVTINATAGDGDGSVSRVDFFIGDTLLGSDTASPFSYSFEWTYPADTVYTLTAQAVDNNGAVSTSAPVEIKYKSSCETRYRQVCHDERQCHQHCWEVCDFYLFGCWWSHTECSTDCEWVPVCVDEPYQYCEYSFVITNGPVPPTPTPVPAPVQPTPIPEPGQECYWIPDRPAQKHQTYIYRLYTKNGDKELFRDSALIPVANNLPEIAGIEPAQGSTTYSNGVINLAPRIIDRDDDTLRYNYAIIGPDSRNSGETASREWTFGSIAAPVQDGQYTWKVIVKDEAGGEVTASGTVIVDKSYPTASFAINNHDTYTNNSWVRLSITDVSPNVQRVELANSLTGPWTNIGLSSSVDWNLSPGDGSKTVYLRAFNQTGVPSQQIIQRSIVLDTVKPSTAGLHVYKKGGTGRVYFSWSGGGDNAGGSGLESKVNLQVFENSVWSDRPGYDGASIELATAGNNALAAIRLQLIDKAGNQSEWTPLADGYSLAAPGAIDLENTTSGYSSSTGHYLNLKLKEVPGVTQYRIECVQNPGGGYSGPVNPGDLSVTNTGLIPHGIYKYKIYTYNAADEATESEVSAGIEVGNNFIATPAGVKPAGYIRQVTGIDFGFATDFTHADPDGDPLTVEYYLSTDGNNFSKLDGAYLNGLASGKTYWWYAKISDGHGGNTQTAPVSFMPDIVPPEITVDNLEIQYATEHKVQLQARDEGSGLQNFRYRINGGAWQVPNGEILITGQGSNTLYVEATDSAGNSATFSHTYGVDRTPPTVSQIQFGLTEQNGRYLAGNDLIPVQWTATDPETGVVQFRYAWSETPGGCDPDSMRDLALLDQQTGYQTVLPGEFEDGKTYYLNIQPQNFLGLHGPIVASPPLLYDQTAPSVKITALSGGVPFSGQYYLTELAPLGVEVEADDPHTGIAGTEYALAAGLSTENAVWHESVAHLVSNTPIEPGKIYYLAVRAVNGTGLMAVAYSQPIFIEATGPELAVNIVAEQSDTRQYAAEVWTKDPETMVAKLQYAIGTAPGETDLSLGLPGAESGWFTVTYPAEKYEIHQYARIPIGTTYYITVKSFNIAGLATTATSQAIRVTGPKATAPEVMDDGYFTSEKTRLHFEWSYSACPKSIERFEYQIRSQQGVIKGWTNHEAKGSVSLTVTGLSLENNTVYFCDVKARFEDGTSSDIGTSNGILVDYSPPVIGNLTAPVYGNGNGIALTWDAADAESGIKGYLGLGTTPGTTDVTKGWLAVGGLKAYQIHRDTDGNNIEFETGQKYYATLMVENGAGLAIQQTSGAIRIDLTAPPVPVVMDDGSYTNRADRLRANWKWTKPDPESGIREYQYTVTTKRELNGGEYWESNGLDTGFELTGINLVQGRTYYIAVKAINRAGAESIGFSDGILVDITAPDPPVAVDYGDYSLSRQALNVDLKASDAQSGIGGYKLSLGTLEDPDEVFGAREIFTTGGLERLNLENLNLAEGKVYFFTVSAVNQANLTSIETKSDGIMVDSRPPLVTKVDVQGRYLSDPDRICFDWEAAETPSGIAEAQYAITTNPNGSGLVWENLDLSGSKTVTGLNLNDGATYYVFVRVQNRAQAENSPDTWSVPARSNPVTIDLTPPVILKVVTPIDGFIGRHFLLQWEGQDDGSGIAEYRYAVGSVRGGADLTDGWVTLVTGETTVSFQRDDIALSDTNAYFISVKAKNGAGVWSGVYQTEAIIADLTPPVITKLSYGSEYLRSTDTIKGILWEANDEQTGNRALRIQPVTARDGRPLDTQPVMTEETSGTIDLVGLSLTDGQTYYIAIQVQNRVLEWSEVKYSTPVVVDITPPVVAITNPAPELVTNSGQMEIPFTISEPGTVEVKLSCPDGREEVQTVTVTDSYAYPFSRTMEGNYSLSLTPTDRAGNPGTAALQKIRLNARPFANIGPDLRITKGTTVHFNPETNDEDGEIVEYSWNFGDPGSEDNTGAEAEPGHTYRELGEYRVTLRVKDNDGKWSDEASALITVTNTFSGELKLDEDWEGEMAVNGDIVVPKGVALRIKAGTRIDFTGNHQIKVLGKILVLGTPENPVIIGNGTAWNGIRLERAEAGSMIQNANIQNATVGLVVYQSQAQIEGSCFKDNQMGIHIVNCAPSLQNCIFEGNSIYGVKEDDAAAPTVLGCVFRNNTIDYYDDELGIRD